MSDSTRNITPPKREKLQHGALTVDVAAHQAKIAGKLVHLSPVEFKLLAYFLQNQDELFTRQDIADHIGAGVDERTVDVYIGRMRRALTRNGAPDPIRTVRTVGYIMDSV